MLWYTLNFDKHVDNNTPKKISLFNEMILLLKCILVPLQKLQTDCLYRMQHDGSFISIEKILNDYFKVVDYDPTNHDSTKTVYLENVLNPEFLYIWQDDEAQNIYLNDDDDDDDDNDVFLENDTEGILKLQFTIFIPDTYVFNEATLRAYLDNYCYAGTSYTIETYTL